MKRVLLMICSICLVLACLFGLFACVAGVKDILNIKDYKEIDKQTAVDGIAMARDGLSQLMENEDTYLNGVSTYEAGVIQLSEGKAQLADGYAQYNAGKAELEAGRKQVADGQAQIDANTQAYNEGKEKLSKIEPLMPYVDKYVEFRDGNLSALPGFDNAQAWFVKIVRPLASNLGIDIPEDVTDFPAFMQDMVADGKAQLKQYEDGLVALEEGKKALADGEKQLADAEKQLADGEAQLADGKAQLADGDKQLSVFEDGAAQLAAGLEQLLEQMTADFTRSGKQLGKGLQELLGDDFSYWQLDEKGNIKVERGCQYLDFEACSKLLDEAEHYLDISEEATTGELYPRVGIYVALGIASIFGLIGGIIGIVSSVTGGKKTGKVNGLICAILAVAANVVGLITGYNDYAYMPMEEIDGVREFTYTADLQMYAMIVLAIVAIIFVIAASAAKKAAKKEECKCASEANAAAAAGVATAMAESDRIADLEAENKALKEMVASLAADAATVKE